MADEASQVPALPAQHLTVPRTARYYTLGALTPAVRDVWIVCHGYGQLAEQFIAPFAPFADASRVIVAPEALSRFYFETRSRHDATSKVGALWMTREDRDAEIADIVTYLDTLAEHTLGAIASAGGGRDTVRLHALGFSQGAAAVSRWTARGRAPVGHLVVWGSGIPGDVVLPELQAAKPGLSVDIVGGDDDSYVTATEISRQAAGLRGAGIPYRIRSFSGGHRLDTETLSELIVGGAAG